MRRKATPIQVAEAFGQALDRDDFKKVRKLVDEKCVYRIGDSELVGPEDIAASYEENMIEGRNTLDELVWGESGVEEVEDSDNEFLIHFTDHIKHQGKSFIHRCKQRVLVGSEGKIMEIEHIDDPDESARLKAFFEQVGLD